MSPPRSTIICVARMDYNKKSMPASPAISPGHAKVSRSSTRRTLMRIVKSAAPLGAEIFDIDLAAGVDQAAFDAIVAAFHHHAVIAFRGQQRLTTEQQVA